MKRYYVHAPVHAVIGMEVEAENEQEAVAKALDDLYPDLCHQCAGKMEVGDVDFDRVCAEELL